MDSRVFVDLDLELGDRLVKVGGNHELSSIHGLDEHSIAALDSVLSFDFSDWRVDRQERCGLVLGCGLECLLIGGLVCDINFLPESVERPEFDRISD